MNNQVYLKFLKGAVTGGLSGIAVALAAGVNIKSLDDLKGVLIILLTAFVSGVIHALVEMLAPTLPATTTSIVSTTAQTPPVVGKA